MQHENTPGESSATGEPSTSLPRSEEHTSELQSLRHLVCRLLLEKKKNRKETHAHSTEIRPAELYKQDRYSRDALTERRPTSNARPLHPVTHSTQSAGYQDDRHP